MIFDGRDEVVEGSRICRAAWSDSSGGCSRIIGGRFMSGLLVGGQAVLRAPGLGAPKTSYELESMLQGLSSNFYPGGSGMGVQKLVPIFEVITRVRDDAKVGRVKASNVELVHEELGELARQALRDNSHEEWFRMAGRVEALGAELQLAFSVEVTKEQANDS